MRTWNIVAEEFLIFDKQTVVIKTMGPENRGSGMRICAEQGPGDTRKARNSVPISALPVPAV